MVKLHLPVICARSDGGERLSELAKTGLVHSGRLVWW